MRSVKMLTILALVTMVCLNEVSEASFLDGFGLPNYDRYTYSNSYGSGGSYVISAGKLKITTGNDNTASVMTTDPVVFPVGEILSLDVPAVSGTGSVFMMCSTSAAQPNSTSTFGFRFRRDGVMYARMDLYPGGIQANTLDPNPDLPATLMVKRTSDTYFEYSIKIEGVQTDLGSFTLPNLAGNYNLHVGAQAYKQTSGTTFAFDNLQVYNPNFTDITVLTYNTHLFEDSTIECLCKCGAWLWKCDWDDYRYEDGTRIGEIVSEVAASGADIVALEEVWAPAKQVDLATRLLATYPYSAYFFPTCDCRSAWPWYIESCVFLCLDATQVWKYYTLGNGLVLLSKWPLSDVEFKRFPTFEQCPILDVKNCTEAWADKGVLTATVNVNGAPIRIGISHALTGPEDAKSKWDTQDVGRATFQLNDEAYIFSLNNINGLAHIRRFEDYSYFNEATQTQKHGAGWKQIYEGFWGTDYAAVVSFELDSHPYLFGLKSSNQGRIFRINDDPATGWTQVYEGPMSSSYVPVTSFELDGHPYIFAVSDSYQGHILRINDDPCTGWSDVYDGNWPAGYDDITSFELDSHPYLFAISNSNQGRILRINDDPCTGWSDAYDGNWPAGYNDTISFELDSHPYIFTYSNTNHWAYIYRINNDPCTGWSYVKNGDLVFPDYIAIKSFDMNGHPYLFAQRNCCDQDMDAPGCLPRPGEAYLKRINDDPNTGWEDLYQLEDIKIIRDATVVDEDGPPAIMMGDFNIHRGKYGIMDELFRKAGAVDAYAQVADTDQDGNTIDIYANGLAQYFHIQQGFPWPPVDPDLVDRIDYVYVKQSGAGIELVPTDAYVDRGWTYRADDMDLSDHYPVFVTFRLETGCAVRMKADFNCDRLVDIYDLTILCSAWLSEPNASAWNLDCDISEPPDEFVDFNDYSEFARQWQTMPIHNITRDKWYEVIQAAINDANDGEEIEASPGYYYEAIDFKGKAITLRSTDPNDPNIVAATVIKGFSHYHVVKCVTGEDANTVLAGFTITGGNANGTGSNGWGGGMYNYYSSPTVTNCKFISNRAGYGGGMFNNGSSPTVTDCNFSDNEASTNGGGMFNDGASPTVTGCNFINNIAAHSGGGMYSKNYSRPTVTNCTFSDNAANGNTTNMGGGGMYNLDNSNPRVTNCTFTSNWALWEGGGMRNSNSSPTMTNCTFSYNTTARDGGGMYNIAFSSPTLTNCILSNNTADWGGGMYNYDNSSPTLTNCTFSGNSAGTQGGGMNNLNNSKPSLTNCILWGNTPEQIVDQDFPASTTLVFYSDVEGGWEGEENIDADPCFIDAVSGDFRLKAGSPCIDAGNNNAIPADTPDLDGDGDTTEPIPFDLNGDPRVWNEIVDMGAFEFTDLRIRNVTRDILYGSIQAAIDDANDYDEIEVAAGTYNEAIDFNGKAVRLYSIAGPNDTTIDGTGNYHVVQCVSGEDANTVLDGFTITGGNANGGIYPNDSGGGMYNDFSSPTVTDCNFSGNSATWGGGMFNYQSSPTVINCNFSGNPADYGGGMSNYQGSNPTVTDCTFSGNSCYIGGGMCNYGGSNPTVTDCIFLSNAASLHGGGMHNDYSDPKVTNCIFSGNTASAHGGGMMNNYGSVSYTANCVFIGNTANGWGGGMCNTSCSPYFINCTFRGNTASSGGAIYSDNSYTNIQNCILWADGANEIVYSSGTMSVTYSDVQGGYSGTGNINADPYFVDAIAGNLRLSSGSPCIDKGSNAGVPPGITTDLDGNPRVLDGDSNGTVIVDMGAYEYVPAASASSSAMDLEYVAVLCENWLAGTEPEL